MRVILLTQYYPPEIGAPQRRLPPLVQTLAERGHTVMVLTAMPNYPTGRIFPGYGGLVMQESRDGARVIRTAIYPAQSAGFLKRLLNYFSFVLSALFFGLLRLPRADYLITESPPLFLAITGYLLARAKGARWVFNVSDLWPESAVRLGVLKPGLGLKASAWLEAFAYRHAWLVSGQSTSIVASIQARFPGVRTFLFSNGVNTDQFTPAQRNGQYRQWLGERTEPVALYAGLHGLAQGLDQILGAVELERAHSPEVFLVGDGPTKRALMEQAQARGLTRVHFIDPVPPAEMPGWVASADIVLVTLKEYIPGAVPSKLYEAMASGAAVLLVARGEPAELVQKYNAGLVVEPGDIAGLADALQKLAGDENLRRQLGANGRRAVQAHFDRATIVNRFVTYLEENL